MPSLRALCPLALLAACGSAALAQSPLPLGTGFTYQGRLTDGGAPANGTYDLYFRLYPSSNSITPIGDPVALEDVQVTAGLFTVTLDFGNEFDGSQRWISIQVRPGASTGTYTSLSPRQQLTAAPYALSAKSLNLPMVDSGSTDVGFIESGLVNIIQNGTDNAIRAQTTSTGAAVSAAASANGTGVHATSEAGRAGWFEITSNTSNQIALFGSTSGTGTAVYGFNTGFGDAVAGHANGPQGSAGYFRIGSNTNTHEAVHAETLGNGAAVYAKASGLGPALQIADGYIKVDNAGQNTPTPVFIHVVSAGSRVNCDSGYCVESVIDHPLCNNAPGAILLITEISPTQDRLRNAPIGSRYDAATGRWHVYSFAPYSAQGNLASGEKFVVMVVRP